MLQPFSDATMKSIQRANYNALKEENKGLLLAIRKLEEQVKIKQEQIERLSNAVGGGDYAL